MRGDDGYVKRPALSVTIHPDLKKTLVSMSERTGMSVSQVSDEVLYTGLIEMQEGIVVELRNQKNQKEILILQLQYFQR